MRNTYVYRLDVTYPEGCEQPGWYPAYWYEGLAEELGLAYSGDEYTREWCRDFVWPKRRTYLSGPAARKQAERLEKCGAKVTVVRSAPVTWPEVT